MPASHRGFRLCLQGLAQDDIVKAARRIVGQIGIGIALHNRKPLCDAGIYPLLA